jgi:alpha-1,3-rhamnosyltransferase
METQITNFFHSTENKKRLVYTGPKKPLVSIIVITYNSGRYVLETLNSIWYQTYEDMELVVSDDFSTDDTLVLCKKWIAAHKTRFTSCKIIESDENNGITKNCNRGLYASSGQWVKIIAGDDV